MALAVDVRGLEKSFPLGFRRRLSVLRGVDVALEEGAVVGLVGPNGSGKSTLLRVLAGVERPTRGSVRVLGGSTDAPSTRARLGFLAERTPFPPELSARDALTLAAGVRIRDRRDRAARVAELLAHVGLARHATRPLGRFSRGMRRRLGLAQAFLHEPELLLLDEPRTGLDAEGDAVLDDLLAEARQRGATVLVASHHAAELARAEDDVVVLVDGRVAAHGSVEELLARTGAVRWSVTGLDERARRDVEARVAQLGGRVVARAPDDRALGELVRDAAREGSE